MAAYELLKNMGAKVSLFDGKKDLDVSGYDAPVFLGKMTKEELAGFALVRVFRWILIWQANCGN